jgi:hypothetical protein
LNRPSDIRGVRRMTAAACAVLGPALIGLVRATYPAFSASKASSTVSAFAHHLGAARVELAAGFAACLIMPFFVLGVYRLTVRQVPVLATVGSVIAVLGWLMTSFMVATDAVAYELARHGGSPAIYDQFTRNAVIASGTVGFLVGHEIGTVLLGAALWRSEVVPRSAATAVIAAPVLHLAAVAASTRGLDIAAFALLTGAGAATARQILRTADSHWDLPPESRPASVDSDIDRSTVPISA